MSTNRTADILLVEDNPGDVRLTREALEHCQFPCRLHVASDGVEALEFLRREGAHAGAPRPQLILLDLNLPRKNGHEVLAEVKADESLRAIPVVVLSSSNAGPDLTKAYNSYANCYLVKPADLDEFFAVVCSLEDFWIGRVQLPTG